MINWRKIKKDHIYSVTWKDPVTYTDEPIGKPYAQRVNVGKIIILGNDVHVISAWCVDPTDKDTDHTKIPKTLVIGVEPVTNKKRKARS